MARYGWIVPVAIFGGLYLLQFALLYFWVPIKTRQTNVLPIDPQFEDVDFGQMPQDVMDAFQDAAGFLAALGFQAQGHLRKVSVNKLVADCFISIWTHRGDGHIAQLIAVRAQPKDGTFKSTSLTTYRRELLDGKRISTSNQNSPRIYPLTPDVNSAVAAGMKDLALLYSYHLARADRAGRPPIRPLPEKHKIIEYMNRDWNSDLEAKEAIGYQRRELENGIWRPTIKGAFLMTWRVLRPWKQINFYLRDRKVDRELRELGFGGLESFRAALPSLNLDQAKELDFNGGRKSC